MFRNATALICFSVITSAASATGGMAISVVRLEQREGDCKVHFSGVNQSSQYVDYFHLNAKALDGNGALVGPMTLMPDGLRAGREMTGYAYLPNTSCTEVRRIVPLNVELCKLDGKPSRICDDMLVFPKGLKLKRLRTHRRGFRLHIAIGRALRPSPEGCQMRTRWPRRARRRTRAPHCDGCMPEEAHTIGALIRQGFRAQGLPLPKVCITSPSMALQASMARTGRLFSVVAASYMRLASDKTSLRIVPVDLRINPPPVGIVTLKHRMVSPVTMKFIECVREVARKAGLPASKRDVGVGGVGRNDPSVSEIGDVPSEPR